jgi:hypothetical protein
MNICKKIKDWLRARKEKKEHEAKVKARIEEIRKRDPFIYE